MAAIGAPAASDVTTSAIAATPTLAQGAKRVEYYSGGVVLGYAKGVDSALVIRGSNTCFRGDWFDPGRWKGSYSSAGGVLADDGDLTWWDGESVQVLLPAAGITRTFDRISTKKARKVWGSTKKAKAALNACWHKRL